MENTFNPNQMPPLGETTPKKSTGPLVAVIVILAIIIIGGLYFLKTRMSAPIYEPTANDAMTESLRNQGSTDDLNSIEADLNATNVNDLDQGATVIEAELQ